MPVLAYFCLLAAATAAQTVPSYSIETVAGSNFAGDGGSALSALLSQPEGLLFDSLGRLYIADADDHRVRRVDNDGNIETVAGTGLAGFSGDGGPAVSAQLNQPYGVALDHSGNLYIADLGNSRVRMISPDGQITTIAGGGSVTPGLLPISATSAQLNAPRNLAVDPANNLYISDFNAQSVYIVTPSGQLSVFAGTGQAGDSGDGGLGISAQLAFPAGLAVDNNGVLYIADSGNNAIRKVSGGAISTFASVKSPTGLATDFANNVYIASAFALGLISHPYANSGDLVARDITVDPFQDLFFSSGNFVSKLDTAGSLTVVAGSGGAHFFGDGGEASSARLFFPTGVTHDASGNIYIADRNNNRIRKVDSTGNISTIYGDGTSATLNQPRSVAIDQSGNLYIADTGNNRVIEINSSQAASIVAGQLSAPAYVSVDASGSLYISDTGNNRVLKASAGVLSTVASVSQPAAAIADPNGNLYISESGLNQVVEIAPTGKISVVAQTLNNPGGLTLDSAGDLFIADSGHNQIVEVPASGSSAIIAGTGAPDFSGDNGPAALAALNLPTDVCTDASGNVLIADSANGRVRKLIAPSVPPPSLNSAPTLANAASFVAGPVAPGEIATIFGGPFDPTSTQVSVNGQPALVFYTSAAQINFLVPAPVAATTTAEIAISSDSQPAGSVTAAVVSSSPALFTTASGSGQAVAQNQDGTGNSSANPAARGSIITLWATGQGTATLPTSISIGGYDADLLYAGPAPGFLGLMQINARVPSGFLPPGVLPVVLTVGGAPSQAGVTLAIQ